MPKMNYTVARVQTGTRDSIGKNERRNERKSEYYYNGAGILRELTPEEMENAFQHHLSKHKQKTA